MTSTTEETNQQSDSEQQQLAPGSVVAGRYEIVRSLGSGGMGSVYLCNDSVLGGDQIAIKILHSDLAADDQQSKRFLREVQLIRKINHRNVVRTFDVGVDGAHMYFTMEFIPGTPLDTLIEQGKVSIAQVGPLMINIAEGLEAIHQAGVTHRDLKPANVMVMADGSIKIADFGVARPEDSNLTAHDEIIGSVLFMAPEIWLGKKLTPSIDLYALGILAYVLTTGEYPFDAEKPAALMRLHLDSAPVPPRDKNSEVPVWLNKLILRLLEKNPAKRPETAADVVEYIKTYTNQRVAESKSGAASASTADNPADFLSKLEEMSQSSVQKAIDEAPVGKRRRTESYVLDVPVRSALFRKMKKDSASGAQVRGRTAKGTSPAGAPAAFGAASSFGLGALAVGAMVWIAPSFSDSVGAAVAEAYQAVVPAPSIAKFPAPVAIKAIGMALLPLLAIFALLSAWSARPLLMVRSVAGSTPIAAAIMAALVWYSLTGVGDAESGFVMQSGVLVEFLGSLSLLSPWVPSRSGSEIISLGQDWLAICSAAALVCAFVFTVKRASVTGARKSTAKAFGVVLLLIVLMFLEGSLLFVGAREVQIRAIGAMIRLPENGIFVCLANWAILLLSGFWFRKAKKPK